MMESRASFTLSALATLPLIAALVGCASYRPAPLADSPNFQPSIAAATKEEISLDEAVALAVLNNPDLLIARSAAGVSSAQAFAAKLLPAPQFNLSRDFPVASGAGVTTAFLAGTSYAINSLITHPATVEAADADVRQVRHALLWQEWQVIAQARLLFVRLQASQQQRVLLDKTRALMADRCQRTRQALALGLITVEAVSPHLAALQDVDRQLHDREKQITQLTADLRALLGLAPTTAIRLEGEPALPPFDMDVLRAQITARLNARPDIVALRDGYAAQDARLRAALLGQFPAFTFGVQRARDTSNAYTRGFSISLSLPIFNGNRGEIAIQNATREKLRKEYQQRLNLGVTDIERVAAEQRISTQQLADVDAALELLEANEQRMHDAWQTGAVDALAFTAAEAALLNKQSERIDVVQAIREQRIGLMTLIGGYKAATKEKT